MMFPARLPPTGMHHSFAVARFALDCLIADLLHHRKKH